ncbi:hypothetical protein TNCV_4476661 [Trichonephila clavipes]|nr:hypothetical protein TNCV_4476661 [Trichonephila clavipes]
MTEWPKCSFAVRRLLSAAFERVCPQGSPSVWTYFLETIIINDLLSKLNNLALCEIIAFADDILVCSQVFVRLVRWTLHGVSPGNERADLKHPSCDRSARIDIDVNIPKSFYKRDPRQASERRMMRVLETKTPLISLIREH